MALVAAVDHALRQEGKRADPIAASITIALHHHPRRPPTSLRALPLPIIRVFVFFLLPLPIRDHHRRRVSSVNSAWPPASPSGPAIAHA